MKAVLLLLLLISVKSDGQIQPVEEKDKEVRKEVVGTAKNFGLWVAECVRFISKDKDTSYTIFFNNAKYTTITDVKHFTFNETGGDFDKLYNLIETALLGKEKKEIEIPLPDGTLTLKFMGKTMQMQWFSKGVLSYSTFITLPQYQKLFGKVDPHAANRED